MVTSNSLKRILIWNMGLNNFIITRVSIQGVSDSCWL